MATDFQVAVLAYGDGPGFAAWQVGHAFQHERYLKVLAARTPPVILPDVPLFRVGETKDEVFSWFQTHYFNVHLPLRQYSGIQGGSDFSYVDLTKPDYFYDFLSDHFAEHQLLDKAFGL